MVISMYMSRINLNISITISFWSATQKEVRPNYWIMIELQPLRFVIKLQSCDTLTCKRNIKWSYLFNKSLQNGAILPIVYKKRAREDSTKTLDPHAKLLCVFNYTRKKEAWKNPSVGPDQSLSRGG